MLKHIQGRLIERDPDKRTKKLVDWLENMDEVEGMLSNLPKREATFIKLYFGIGTGYPITLSELARIHGMSRSRGQRILERAMRLMSLIAF
jgi:DNA-directed RNA polymerase sigma subunit (sigma70/sigma32)